MVSFSSLSLLCRLYLFSKTKQIQKLERYLCPTFCSFRFQLWNQWCEKIIRGNTWDPIPVSEQHRALNPPGQVTGERRRNLHLLVLHQRLDIVKICQFTKSKREHQDFKMIKTQESDLWLFLYLIVKWLSVFLRC